MLIRLWDTQNNKWASVATALLRPCAVDGYYSLSVDTAERFTIFRGSDMKDKSGRIIFEGDIVKVKREDGRFNEFIVRYGKTQRSMDTGALVEINGFYFELVGEGFFQQGYFQIAKNWNGGHDSELTEVVGNVMGARPDGETL